MDDKKILFNYLKDENGSIDIVEIGVFEDGNFSVEPFDQKVHGDLFLKFLEDNEISGAMSPEELAEKGIFDKSTVEPEDYLNYFSLSSKVAKDSSHDITSDNLEDSSDHTDFFVDDEDGDFGYDDDEEYFDDEDEYVDEDSNDSKFGKRVLATVLAAGAVVGGLSLFHSCSDDSIQQESSQKDLEQLLNEMTPNQRNFFKSSFDAVETFNNNTVKEDNFKVEKDTSVLHMTVDEAISLNIVLNNYSSDDLYEIFGTVEFDTTNVMNLARSAYSKLSTYYMNAKEPSGISAMINDEVAREFFEKHENLVIEFNNNPSIELSDNVVKGLYYDYVVNGSTGEYAKINNDGVAWLSTSAGFGYELANRNVEEFLRINNVGEEEIEQYKNAAARVGLSLNKITTGELLSGINEEIDIDIMDEVDNKSLCFSVTSQTKDKIEGLTLKQQIASTIIETNAKDALVDGLRESGYINLANKLIASEVTPSLLEEIADTNSKTNELVEDYNNRLNALLSKEAKVMAVLNLAMEKYNVKEEINLAELVNNRFRTPLVAEKEPVVDTTPGVTTEEEKKEQLKEDLYIGDDENGDPVYDGNKLNELPDEEKEEFIKDNGVIVDKKEENVDVPVQKEDLTPEELEEVVSEENILSEIEQVTNGLIKLGVTDGNSYTEEAGAYKYSGEIVIEWNLQKIDTKNLSLAKIAQMAYAYENVEISVEDKQIQERMKNDAKNAETVIDSLSAEAISYLKDKYGSDWKTDLINESYIAGYTGTVKSTLETAKEQGKILRDETEKAYFALLEQQENQNTVEGDTEQKDDEKQESVPENKPDQDTNEEYDPNLDPNYGMEDEEVIFNPSGIYSDNSNSEQPTTGGFEKKNDEIPKTSLNHDGNEEMAEENSEVIPENMPEHNSSEEYDPNLDSNYGMEDEEVIFNPSGHYEDNSNSEQSTTGDSSNSEEKVGEEPKVTPTSNDNYSNSEYPTTGDSENFEEKNEVVPEVAQTDNTSNEYDPNLDPNYGMEDEVVINLSGYYAYSPDLEQAFDEAIGSSRTR